MPTLAIDDFRHGLDTRKSALTAEGGSLTMLTNAYLTPGGEIEKRKAFVPVVTLPANQTFGLIGQGGNLHVFGTAPSGGLASLPYTFPDPLDFQLLYHQLGATFGGGGIGSLSKIYSITTAGGKFGVTGKTNYDPTFWWDGNVIADSTNTSFLLQAGYTRFYQSKLYATKGTDLYFSSINDPTKQVNNAANPGGGFIDLSAQDPDVEQLGGIEVYYNRLAIFARLATQIWAVDPDPTQNALSQVVRIGTMAPRSVMQFGNGDVLFLSDSGIRSLRALNYTLAAGIIDVGSPVDNLVTADILASASNAAIAVATVQPVAGRYWLALGNTVYVLSFFPSAKISAWSQFTLPFVVSDWARVGNRVFCRSGDTIYLYGGLNDATYDTSEVRIRTPHLCADKPTVLKKINGLAVIGMGNWTVNLGCVADQPTLYEAVANITEPTVATQRIPAAGKGTHFGVELVSNDPTYALLSSVAVDYTTNERL